MDGPGASFLGLSVGLIQQDVRPGASPQLQLRHHLYHQLELGFDYLRGNMAAK